MKIFKKLSLTVLTFGVCQLLLIAIFSNVPSQYLPSQKELLEAIAYAKASHDCFLLLSLATFICLLAPISEEVIFRLSLSNLQLLPWSFFCLVSLISAGLLLPFDLQTGSTLWLRGAWLLLVTLGLWHFCKGIFYLKPLQSLWCHRLSLLLLTSLVFALLHIDWDQITGLVAFVVILSPYLFLGVVIGLVRLHLGFFYGVLYHLLNNLTALLVVYWL